jgi:hypothetical protein
MQRPSASALGRPFLRFMPPPNLCVFASLAEVAKGGRRGDLSAIVRRQLEDGGSLLCLSFFLGRRKPNYRDPKAPANSGVRLA